MMTPYHVNALLQREREREMASRLAFVAARVRACCRPGRVARLVSGVRRQHPWTEGA